jgi:hypothetical protein
MERSEGNLCICTFIITVYELNLAWAYESVPAPLDSRNLLLYSPRGRIAGPGIGCTIWMWRILQTCEREKFFKWLVKLNCVVVYLCTVACIVCRSVHSAEKSSFLDDLSTYFFQPKFAADCINLIGFATNVWELCLQYSSLHSLTFLLWCLWICFIRCDEFTTREVGRKQNFSCILAVGVYVVAMSQCFV